MNKPLFVILAGGGGKRFIPLTTDKILFPFLGKPFIEHVLDTIAEAGGEDVLIVTNSKTEDWLPSYRHPKLRVEATRQPEPKGMADALLNAAERIGERPIIVLNGDDIVEPALLKSILAQANSAYSLITGKEVQSYFPGGYLQVENNRVVSIIEKPEPGTEPSNLINLVVHYFSRPQDFFQALHEVSTDKDDQYEQALARLMQEHEVGFVPYTGTWQALKYSHHVLDMMHLLLSKRLKKYTTKSASIAKSATIVGEVYIDDGAKIFENAVIKGPVYIGRNAIVGNNSLIRESIIEEGTVVGFGSEVTRSYVGPCCMLHHNFIGDSIFEADINPSWGTCTANWRFDNKPVRVKIPDSHVETTKEKLGAIVARGAFFGVNCAIMPGVTVGANTKVFPGTVLYHPVPADEIVRVPQKLLETES